MPKKNIFIFSTAYFPFVGGAEIAVKEITDRIPDFDFILFTAKIKRGLPKKEKIGNVLVFRLGFGFSFDKILLPFSAFFKYFTIIRNFHLSGDNPQGQKLEIKNSLLWSVMSSYGGIAAYFIKLAKPNIPFLLTLQEGDSERHLTYGKLGLVGFFSKRIIRKADYIQVISSYLKNLSLKQGARAPIAIVPNGADFIKIQNAKIKNQNDILKFKNNLKIQENEKIIITTSRLVYKNGIDVLIKSICELKNGSHKLEVKLLILGEGAMRKGLEKLVSDLNLEKEILFLGFVPPERVYDYLMISDVFVRPSRSEGLGNSFLEAMACGAPVVGTPVGGIPDFLTHGETGLFCEVDNSNDLAEKIKLILENNGLREKITTNGKKLVEENYNWDGVALKMKELFNLTISL